MTRKDGTGTARALRRRQTNAEAKLWFALRNRQLDGWKFKRQAPIGPFVVDFLCAEAKVIIEVDGIQHLDRRAIQDARRTEHLEQAGYRVIRFWNSDVRDNLESVVGSIWRAIQEQQVPYRISRPVHRYDASRALAVSTNKAPSHRPSPRRGEGGGPGTVDGGSS